MSFIKSKGFKRLKNLLIGVGAALVLAGALFKLESWEGASEMLILGMGIEIFIFLLLGILPPEPDYYWHKLYPGLDDYNSRMAPITAGGPSNINLEEFKPLHGDVVEKQLGGMLAELQNMSKSMTSLKALQEVVQNTTLGRVYQTFPLKLIYLVIYDKPFKYLHAHCACF